MSTGADQKFLELLTALDPFLNTETRKSCQAVKDMLDQLDQSGLSFAEVAKKLKADTANARKGVPALAARARALLNGGSQEFIQALLDDAFKLSQANLKKLGKELNLDLSSDKLEVNEDIRKWIESGGQIKPPDARARAEQCARQLAGNLPDRMRGDVTGQVADEVKRKADDLGKDKKVGKDVLEAFGKLLGIPVTGSKPAMLKQIKQFVDRLAVSHGQTRF
jgi:hypothetical protein